MDGPHQYAAVDRSAPTTSARPGLDRPAIDGRALIQNVPSRPYRRSGRTADSRTTDGSGRDGGTIEHHPTMETMRRTAPPIRASPAIVVTARDSA